MSYKRSYLLQAILLTMLVVINGELFGNKGSSRDLRQDPASTNFFKVLKSHIKKEKDINQQATMPSPQNMTENAVVRTAVKRKFQMEMQKLFGLLPEREKCKHLKAIARTTRCNITVIVDIVFNLTLLQNIKDVKCSMKKHIPYSICARQNVTKVTDSFWKHMGILFRDNITIPFQCNIINTISSSSSRYHSRRQGGESPKQKGPRITLQMAEWQLERIVPFLNVKQKCSKVWKPLKERLPLQSPASLLNLTVRLYGGSRRKTWLKRLRTKGREIYQIYLQYHKKTSRQRPLIPQSKTPLSSPAAGRTSVRLNIVRVTKSNRTISVIFGVEVSNARTVHFRKITPAKLIINALKSKGQAHLDSLFNASVVQVTRARQEQQSHAFVLSQKDITNLKQLFPQYLKSYYKQLERLERCFIMLFISSSVQIGLRPTESIYNTFAYIPRKYFCSSTRRQTNLKKQQPIIKIETIYRQRTTVVSSFQVRSLPHPTITNQKTISIARNNTVIGTSKATGDDFPEEEEGGSDEKGVTALEVVLFVLLGLLCLAILAFTVNCILFALKPKSSDGDQQNSVFARAVFRRIPRHAPCDEQDQVTVTLNAMEDPNVLKAFAECCCHTANTVNGSSPQPSQDRSHNNDQHGKNDTLNEHNNDSSRHVNDANPEVETNQAEPSKDIIPTPDRTNGELTLSHSIGTGYQNSLCDHCRCSAIPESQDTTTEDSSSSQRENISRNDVQCSSKEDREEPNRTIKECSGGLKIVHDSETDSVKFFNDPWIKSNSRTVVVLLDQSEAKEDQV